MGDKKTPGKKSKVKENKPQMTFEPCILGKAKVWLPVDLVEDPCILRSVISQETWDSVLTQDDRNKLSELLPTFPEEDEKEKAEALRCLFAEENLKFGNPLTTFSERLRAGFMDPEIAEMERSLQQATHQDYKYAQQRRLHRLLKEVLISRQELLEAAMFTSPSAPVPVKRRLYRNDKAVDGVVNKKCKKMLAASKEDASTPDSSDEDDSKQELNGFHTSPSHDCGPDAVLGPRWTDFWPKEYDDLEKARTHSTFDPKPTHHEGGTPTGKLSSPSKPMLPVTLTQQQYIRLMEDYQDRMEDEHLKKHPELNTKTITLTQIISRAFPIPPPVKPTLPGVSASPEDSSAVKTGKKRKDKEKDKKKRKKKKMPAAAAAASTLVTVATFAPPPKSTTPVSVGSADCHSPVDILSTPESRHSTDLSISPATCSPGSAGSTSSDIKPPLRVHPSFFSLIRDIFSAAPFHRLPITKLRDSLANWQRSPVSMLSTWAVLQPSWARVVDGAMKFLNGEIDVEPEVIPRVRYDEERQMWQWRSELPPDSEEELVTLFKQWLDTLPGMRAVPPKVKETSTTSATSPPHTTVCAAIPPLVIEPTLTFPEQERERYSQPHKAYIYKMASYQATVGPVKGVFSKDTNLNKAREHALLISDRPSYVTILSLVRDAVARLPNGEGTRAAVCELLKESQYLAESSDVQINNVVSGALDRLHYEKDPCIKYDSNRKLWVYLHRDRTKEEFERLHKEQAEEAKARKSIARQTKLLPKIAPSLRDSPSGAHTPRPGSAMSDTSSENLSIEVCSPKGSPGRASSPKPSRKSPAYAKSMSAPGSHGSADRRLSNISRSTSVSRSDHPGVSRSEALMTSSSKMLSGNILGQAPFVISPRKVGSLQSALRDLHQGTGGMPASSSDSLIKAQLLAAKSGQTTADTLGLLAPTMPHISAVGSSSMVRDMGGGDMASRISGSGFGFPLDQSGMTPKVSKSLSVPCTLPDGKVVMLTPDLVVSSAKTRKRAKSGSGGRKKGSPALSESISDIGKIGSLGASGGSTSSSPTQGSKPGRKSSSASPSPLTVGPSKLTTVSEALAQKRAEAALQSGRQQARAASTITLHPGALKGQTVKSILASVGIPLSGASVTVTRIDTPGAQNTSKQSTPKGKDSRKSPVFSGVNLIGGHTAKGRPASAPSMSGKKSPITNIHQTFGHQTIGLTTVTKDGQIVVQPVALGLERPGSSSSPGVSRPSSNPSGQALTIKAIPMSLTKQQSETTTSSKDSSTSGRQSSMEFVTTKHSVDEVDSAVKSRGKKSSRPKQQFVAGTAAAALAQAGKMSGGGDLKDFASVPLSVLLPGARQGGMTGTQKGGVPVLTNPFLPGSQIPLASLADGKGVIFQMPPGSNIMSLPVSGVGTSPRSSMSSTSGQIPSPASSATTSAPSSKTPVSGVRTQSLQMHLSAAGASQARKSASSRQQKTGSPALSANLVSATIRSALAAVQSRNNLTGVQARLPISQQAAQMPQQSAAMKMGGQNLAGFSGTSLQPPQMRLTGPQSHVTAQQRSRQDPKGSSLTASSIASIIANLKQNPMAAISLPSVPPPPIAAQSTALARALSQPTYSLPRTAVQSPTSSRVSAAQATNVSRVMVDHSPNVSRVSVSTSSSSSRISAAQLPSMSRESEAQSLNVSRVSAPQSSNVTGVSVAHANNVSKLSMGQSSNTSRAQSPSVSTVTLAQSSSVSRISTSQSPIVSRVSIAQSPSVSRVSIAQSPQMMQGQGNQSPAFMGATVSQSLSFSRAPAARSSTVSGATVAQSPDVMKAPMAQSPGASGTPIITTQSPLPSLSTSFVSRSLPQIMQSSAVPSSATSLPSAMSAVEATSNASATVAALQAKFLMQSQAMAETTSANPAAATPPTQSKLGAAPHRVIPPFEPRVTRGKTKGQDKTNKNDPA